MPSSSFMRSQANRRTAARNKKFSDLATDISAMVTKSIERKLEAMNASFDDNSRRQLRDYIVLELNRYWPETPEPGSITIYNPSYQEFYTPGGMKLIFKEEPVKTGFWERIFGC